MAVDVKPIDGPGDILVSSPCLRLEAFPGPQRRENEFEHQRRVLKLQVRRPAVLTAYSILRQLQAEKDVVSKRRFFPANRSIISEGTLGRRLYLIEHGRVRVTTRVKLKNHRHIRPGLRELGPSEVFGELALFDEGRQCFSVVTIEDTELLEFEVEPLLEYLDRHPESGYVLLQQLLRLLTHRLIQADLRLKSLFAWGLEVQGIDKHL